MPDNRSFFPAAGERYAAGGADGIITVEIEDYRYEIRRDFPYSRTEGASL
jgi:hypothetical protein